MSVVCGVLLAAGGLVSPGASAAPAPTPAPYGIPKLTDEHGRVLTLRGWNVEDKTHRGDRALSLVTEKHFRDMSGQGFNFARLLVYWDDLEAERGQYSEKYLRKIDRILGWAHRYGVKVLIDGHQDVFGPAFGHRGIPEWATRTDGLPFTPHPDDWFSEYFQPAVQRAFTHLYEDADLQQAQARVWRLLADRYGDHPAVLGCDFLNEPMGELKEGEDLPTAARRIERDQITPMHNRLAAAVRSVDAKKWLFVEPTPIVGEGVPTGLGRIKDPKRKVVYAPHFYNTAMEAGADYDPQGGWIEAYEAAVTQYPKRYGVAGGRRRVGPAQQRRPEHGRLLPGRPRLLRPLQLGLGGLRVVLRGRVLRGGRGGQATGPQAADRPAVRGERRGKGPRGLVRPGRGRLLPRIYAELAWRGSCGRVRPAGREGLAGPRDGPGLDRDAGGRSRTGGKGARVRGAW
ncbi:endoglycosylceramidase [Streptomyces candidus]|uniref:Endoglycosylceramidase n=1 Tax=Streptomyces candidus TaxID=67283 RepID=A0A7X0HH23_9ACTN|nr:endoglycosylceramidase [Streptomyces candidus]